MSDKGPGAASPQPESVEAEVPARIGPFRVVRPLARGGMAAVFEVEEPETGRRFAAKLLGRRGMASTRFRREYRALTRMNHPNIVRVYRFGIADGDQPYITMELLDGVPAQVHAKASGRPGSKERTAEVVRITVCIADALAYLHARGIIHRDLKSSNVLVMSDGSVKLLDFGTAHLQRGGDEITSHGEFVGTFAYASPEQLKGEEVDSRSDVYSFGVLFYRLLTGKRPFEAPSPHALARLHIEQAPRPPESIAPGLPLELSALVLSMLAKRPDERIQSAALVAAALRAGGLLAPTPDLGLDRLSRPALVGRTAEMDLHRQALLQPVSGSLTVTSGPTGSGRRMLLDLLAGEARDRGWAVVDVGFPGPPGLGALADAISQAMGRIRSVDLQADLLRLSSVPPGEMPDADARQRLVAAALRLLAARQQDGAPSLCLLFRDLDRAPPLASRVLAELRQGLAEQRLPVVIFASVQADAADAPAPALERFPLARRVHLGPLRPDEVGVLVGSMLGRRPPPPELARTLHAAAGGLPGYVEELVRAMAQAGMVEFRRDAGEVVTWVDRSDGRIALPGSVRDAVRMRLDGQDRCSTRILEALAIAGDGASTEVLALAVDRPDDEVGDAVAALAEARLIRPVEGSEPGAERWTFHLGLTADLVRQRTRRTRRYVMQRRLADAIADAPPTPHKVQVELVAGRLERAAADAMQWAEGALEGSEAGEVEAVLAPVVARVEASHHVPASTLARLHLQLARGRAARDAGDLRIDIDLQRALTLAAGPAFRAELEWAEAQLLRERGRLSDAQERLRRARNRLDRVPNAALRVAVEVEAGDAALDAGDLSTAQTCFDEALRGAWQADDRRGEGRARLGRGRCAFVLGDLETAIAELRHAVAVLADVDDGLGRCRANRALAQALAVEGRLSESATLLEDAAAWARGAGRQLELGLALLGLAELDVLLFRLGQARERLHEIGLIGAVVKLPSLWLGLAVARASLEFAAETEGGAVQAAVSADALDAGTQLCLLHARALAWRGLGRVLIGRLPEGLAELDLAARTLGERGALVWQAEVALSKASVVNQWEPAQGLWEWLQGAAVRVPRVRAAAIVLQLADKHDTPAAALGLRRALDALRSGLDPDDQAALRVHPWQVGLDALVEGPRHAE